MQAGPVTGQAFISPVQSAAFAELLKPGASLCRVSEFGPAPRSRNKRLAPLPRRAFW